MTDGKPPLNRIMRGTNLAGGEYGAGASAYDLPGEVSGLSYDNPGRHGTEYMYPQQEDFAYIASRLPDPIVRFNFRIERISQGPGLPMKPSEVAIFHDIFDAAHAEGVKLIPTPWNFGAVWHGPAGEVQARHPVGTEGFTIEHFADFWRHFAAEFGSHPAIIAVGLMTEPVAIRPKETQQRSGQHTSLGTFSKSLDGWDFYTSNSTVTHTFRNGAVRATKRFSANWDNFLLQRYFHGVQNLSAGGRRMVARVRLETPIQGNLSASIALSVGSDYVWWAGPSTDLVTGQWVDIIREEADDSLLRNLSGVILSIGGSHNVTRNITVSVQWVHQEDGPDRLSPAGVWEEACQAAVDAIREVDQGLIVWVPNYGWSTSNILNEHPNGPWIVDPTGNFGYEGHHYSYNRGGAEADYNDALDSAQEQGFTFSGGNDALVNRELDAITTFASWLDGHHGYIGEWGIPQKDFLGTVGWSQWRAYGLKMLAEYDKHGWWASAWTSGRVLGSESSHFNVYRPTNGWNNHLDSASSVAAIVEAHPSRP